MKDLAAQVLDGSRLALARLLTHIENETAAGRAALDTLFAHTGRAHLIGITGSPGTGKSSLVNQLARAYRNPPDGSPPRTVAIVAVDPSSPFTGGALLGDRVRMRDLAGDPGVFIRSMASRGALGGLARATAAVVQALDAAGFDLVMIETVGAGQSEVDIASLAHTILVVEAPGMGDDIQAIKAGILEIADIIVINKADRPGAENAERTLRAMIELGRPRRGIHHLDKRGNDSPDWLPPVVMTVATQAEGIPGLLERIEQHARYLRESGQRQARDRARLQAELQALIQHQLVARWQAAIPAGVLDTVLDQLAARRLSPYQALSALLDRQPDPNIERIS